MGVRPSASTDEIRTAYRELARRLHPDRLSDASPAERTLAERRMREINESWSVLREPVSRRRYDESRLASARTGSGRSSGISVEPRDQPDDDDLVDVAPSIGGVTGLLVRHLPWIVIVAVLVGIFVVTAYAGSSDDPSPGRTTATTVPAVGTCLSVASGPVATPVSCSGPYDVRVVARVDELHECPRGSERRRLFHDGKLDCVRPA